MSPDLPRFSAASGLLAGLFLAVAGFVSIFTGKTAGAAFVIALAPALAIPLLVAVYHQRHADVPGLFGPVAYAVNLIGLGLFGGAVFTSTPRCSTLAPRSGTTSSTSRPSWPCWAAPSSLRGSVLFGVFLLSPLHASPLLNANHVLARRPRSPGSRSPALASAAAGRRPPPERRAGALGSAVR